MQKPHSVCVAERKGGGRQLEKGRWRLRQIGCFTLQMKAGRQINIPTSLWLQTFPLTHGYKQHIPLIHTLLQEASSQHGHQLHWLDILSVTTPKDNLQMLLLLPWPPPIPITLRTNGKCSSSLYFSLSRWSVSSPHIILWASPIWMYILLILTPDSPWGFDSVPAFHCNIHTSGEPRGNFNRVY